MMPASLIRISLRSGRKQPLRTVLMIMGIALGVAGVVAIDIARSSLDRSFELSTALLTSRATHQIVGSRFEIPQSIFTALRTELGVARSAPVIESHVRAGRLTDTPLRLMGVDPFSESAFRPFQVRFPGPEGTEDFSRLLTNNRGALISGRLAEKAGIKTGDELDLGFGDRRAVVTIAGLLQDRGTGTGAVLDGIILTDISLAQEMMRMEDRITRIDLILDDDTMVDRVNALLPKGVFLVETDRRNHVIQGLSSSFEASLAAFSMLALFMGVFLIYNTVSFSVTRRQKLYGILKAVGATRKEIFHMVTAEVLIYAFMGAFLGIGLGILMGKGAVRAVLATASDMYYVLTVTRTQIEGATLLKGLAAGVAASAAACLFPAVRAARTLPVTLMQRSFSESTLKKYIPIFTAGGIWILLCSTGGLIFFDSSPALDFIGVFACFAGASFLMPLVIVLSVWLGTVCLGKNASVILKMAMGNVTRSLSRTSVLIASLMVVVSVYIGIEVMTRSFRFSIIDWVDGHIGGHIHVSSADTLNRHLDPVLVERITRMPMVADMSAYNIHRIYSQAAGEFHIFSYLSDRSVKKWVWTAAPEAVLDSLLAEGWIYVSEIFARQNRVRAEKGAGVTLETAKGRQTFRVAGIFRDFFMGGGRVIVSRQSMKNFWGYDDITALQVFLKAGAPVDTMIEQIRLLFPKNAMVEVISGQSIKKNILNVFDKTFVITSALQVLTAIVALTGILNAVMALLLERGREMGILRACGARKGQVGQLMLAECGICGAVAGIAAIPLGLFLSWVLIYIINQRAFGWTYEMVLPGGVFVQALALSVLASVAAGIVPSVKAGGTDIGDALRME